MKHIYQSPETMVVTVKMRHHLMDPSIQATATPASVNGNNEYETLSRRNSSIWDDDEE